MEIVVGGQKGRQTGRNQGKLPVADDVAVARITVMTATIA